MDKRTARLAFREAKKKHKELKKKRNEAKRESTRLEQEIKHLTCLMDECEAFGIKEVEDDVNIPNIQGVYIVAKQEGISVTLRHFFNLVRGDDVKAKEIKIDVFKDNPMLLTDDGKVMDFSLGALHFVSHTPVSKGHAFRLLNVGPEGDDAKTQYQYALSKLGLAVEPVFDHKLLAEDGQFRTLLSNLTKKEEN